MLHPHPALIAAERRMRIRVRVANQHGKAVVEGEGLIQKDER